MTAWTPDIKIFYLPPNSDLSSSNPRIEVTDLVDYSILTSRGSTDYITPPYPAQTSVSLLFDENVIPDIQLGSWVEVRYFEAVDSTYQVLHSGFVVNRTSAYRSYGLTGFVLEWTFTLASAISILQNMTWYNPSTFTGTTTQCLERIVEFYGKLMWNQINSNISWENYGPSSWAEIDTPRLNTLPNIDIENEFSEQSLEIGFRNVWDDITTLVYGVYGYVYESQTGAINTHFVATGYSGPAFTITQDIISPDIVANDSFDKLRNEITFTKFDDSELTYYDDDSITLYSERSGSLNTYLTQTLEVANIAQTMLNGLAYPTFGTERVSIDLMNPNVTDIQRGLLRAGGIGTRWRVEAPIPMGGSLLYLIIGAEIEMTRNNYTVNLNLVPFDTTKMSTIWARIPYSYTWTSYGVAFPTQEWQDL